MANDVFLAWAIWAVDGNGAYFDAINDAVTALLGTHELLRGFVANFDGRMAWISNPKAASHYSIPICDWAFVRISHAGSHLPKPLPDAAMPSPDSPVSHIEYHLPNFDRK